jgi:hypothetical protein
MDRRRSTGTQDEPAANQVKLPAGVATSWPFGLLDTDVDTDALRAFLGFRITVMPGTADLSTTGRFFPKSPRSMRQGATRYERAHTYVPLADRNYFVAALYGSQLRRLHE